MKPSDVPVTDLRYGWSKEPMDFHTLVLKSAATLIDELFPPRFGGGPTFGFSRPEVPQREEKLSPQYAEQIEETKARIARLASMTLEEADQQAEAEYQSRLESQRMSREASAATRRVYEDALSSVEKWRPPSRQHRQLKDVIEQALHEQISRQNWMPERPTRRTGETWLAEARDNAAKCLELDKKWLSEETERIAKRNAWVEALYASLPEPAKQTSDAILSA